MKARAALCILLLGGLPRCAVSRPAVQTVAQSGAPQPKPGAAAPRDQAVPPVALSSPPSSPVSLRAGQSWVFLPRALVRQLPPERMTSDDLARFVLRPQPAEASGLSVVIDDQAPRPLVGARTLGELVLEDRELAPGPHVIVVFRLKEGERSVDFQAAKFLVDVAEAPGRAVWSCVLVAPRGTVYGQLAEQMEVLALPLDPRVRSVTVSAAVRIAGAATASESRGATPGESLLMSSDASGDVLLEVTCLDDRRATLTVLERVLTVNRELPAPTSPPGEQPSGLAPPPPG